MAKTRTKFHNRRKNFTIPMAIVGGFVVPAARTIDQYKAGGFTPALNEITRDFTGYQPNIGGWSAAHLQFGLLPVGLGVLIHKMASAFGVNRAIAAAGIPLLRI